MIRGVGLPAPRVARPGGPVPLVTVIRTRSVGEPARGCNSSLRPARELRPGGAGDAEHLRALRRSRSRCSASVGSLPS